jgi:hypothetical protein
MSPKNELMYPFCTSPVVCSRRRRQPHVTTVKLPVDDSAGRADGRGGELERREQPARLVLPVGDQLGPAVQHENRAKHGKRKQPARRLSPCPWPGVENPHVQMRRLLAFHVRERHCWFSS